MSYDTMDAQVEDLSTYAVNFSDDYYNGLGQALSNSWENNHWNQGWALMLIKSTLIDLAAKDYKREFGSTTESAEQMWPTGIRWAAAGRVYDHFAEEFKLGNFYSQGG